MNERIRELAVMCGAWNQVYNNKEFMVDRTFKVEKFAELIIQECINIVKPTQHHEAFAQGYLGDVEGLELLDNKVKQIKQHFGVE
jgi:hypothetical protein